MDSTIALTYRRVSTYRQEREGVSLDVQTDQCLDYIRRQPGWRLGGDFHDTLSGRRSDRPDYRAMLEEAKALRKTGRRVVIVTAALDRLGRDLGESVRAREELAGLDIPIHCIREGGVMSELQANLLATIAQDEAARIRARVKGSRKRNRDHGYRSTSRAPWGYVWSKTSETEQQVGVPKSILHPDPATVEYVQEAWRRAAAGESIRSVARWIDGLTSEARGGRKFKFGNVLAMFKNPTYIARIDPPERGTDPTEQPKPGRGKTKKLPMPDREALALTGGRWEPLVSDETWLAVHEQIARHQRMPRQARGEYLLTGVIRCPNCEQRMQGRSHTSGRLYSCSTPNVGCYFGGRADAIDGEVLRAIAGLLDSLRGDTTLRAALRATWERMQKPPTRPGQARIKTLERLVENARRRQEEALTLLTDRVIDRERYFQFDQREQRDIEAAERELAEIRAQEAPPVLPPFDEVMREVGSWRRVMAQGTVPEQRDVLAVLVQQVTPVRVGRARYAVDILWSSTGKAIEQALQQAGETAGAA